MGTTSRQLEELLAHGPWVRALAQSLVRDPASADDLVQQAWVAALERPPAGHGSLRRWFAAVLRNLARQDRRAGERRAARERFGSARGPESPADELGATLELSKRLADAVDGLDEPYRSAIFRRYYEGHSPARIAELDRLPLKTVKTRLARGLEKLRERLDREHDGDRAAWVSACLPLLHGPDLPVALGGILMNVKIACALAGLVLVGAWAVLRPGAGEVPGKPVELAAPSPAPAATLEAPAANVENGPGEARANLASAVQAPASVSETKIEAELPGRVIDNQGLPLAEVRLFLVTPAEAQKLRLPHADASAFRTRATSGPDGRFALHGRPESGVLMGARPGLVTLLAADSWSSAGRKELIVVMAPAVDIGGLVVDEQQQPIAGAELRVDGGERVRRELGHASDTAVDIPWSARSDEHGRFAFEGVPGVASAELLAFHPRYTRVSIPLPETTRSDLRIALHARESTVVAGEVLEPNGLPVEAALVGMGQMTTRTDAQGRFELELNQVFVNDKGSSWIPPSETQLSAVKPGRLPARMEQPATGWPGFVTLVIGGEPLSIRGKVLDPQGQPLAGIDVRATNEHTFGIVTSKVGNVAWTRSFESLARGGEDEDGAVRSDAQGEFELRGLLDADYVLRAFERKTLRLSLSAPVHAGRRDVELRFAQPTGFERVAGRVLSVRGGPIVGVNVFPGRPGVPNPSGEYVDAIYGAAQVTDAEGRFDFGEIAVEGLQLQVSGDELQTVVSWKPPAGAKLSELELRASRRCHLQVDLGDRPQLADTLVVLDESGQELEQWIWTGNMASFGMWTPIRDGKSDVVTVPENAATVVLKKDGVEVQRRSVALKPGELETVRF